MSSAVKVGGLNLGLNDYKGSCENQISVAPTPIKTHGKIKVFSCLISTSLLFLSVHQKEIIIRGGINVIIKINGKEITPAISTTVEEEVIVIGNGKNKKLRKIATMFWSISATFMVKSQALAASATGSGQLWEQMKPLLYFFQDMAMFAGTLAIIAGIILLVFKRRWGVATIKTTAFAVAGIFLVPSAVLLLAILGMFLDDSLTTVLNGIREARMVGGN